MGSSKYYRLWLRDGEPGSNWVEITRFTGFHFKKLLNGVPGFEADINAKGNSSLQSLITGNRIFRITNDKSSDGTCKVWSYGSNITAENAGAATGSAEIMTGRLNEPKGDQKFLENNKPVVWHISGSGFFASLAEMKYSQDKVLTGTFNNILTRASDGIITDLGSRLAAGTIDTGPTVSILARKNSVAALLLEIARIGDGTDKFPFIIEIDHDSSFVPRINLFKPTNAIFENSNPFNTTRDEGRIIDAYTETRSYQRIPERDRVRNIIRVRYGGVGSGISQTESSNSPFTDTTFQEPREAVVFAPLLQDDASANLLGDTMKNVFKGTIEGLVRAEAVLKTAALFETAFDGVLGDNVGLESTIYKDALLRLGTPWVFLDFEETSGTTVFDTGGAGHNATSSGGLTGGATGLIVGGKAYTFDGVNDLVSWSSYPPSLTSFTAICWVKTTTNGKMIMQLQHAAGNSLLYLSVGPTTAGGNNNQFVVYIRNSAGTSQIPINSSTVINDGNTHMVSVTWDGATVTLYVDGEPKATAAIGGTLSSLDTFKIGGVTSYEMAGTFDGFSFHDNVVLTERDMKALWAIGSTGGLVQVQDKFMGFEYDQSEEALKVTIGLPRIYNIEKLSDFDKAINQLYSGMKSSVSKTVGQVKFASTQPASASNATLADGSSLTATLTATRAFDRSTDDNIVIYCTMDSNLDGGEYIVEVDMGSSGTQNIYRSDRLKADANGDMFFTIVIPAQMVQDIGQSTNDTIKFTIVNKTGGARNVTLNVRAWITPPHQHDM